MTGKIIKGIGGFYYVVCENGITYECKAKGVFRNRKIKPLVGDNVEIEILDEEKNLGNIEDILPRFNWLNRPAVANVDQTVIIFAVSAPAPNFNLLDRFLIDRIIDIFPTNQQQQVRVQLAMVLEGVISQSLLPTANGQGRVAAFEVMLASPAIRSLIREAKTHQIQSTIQTSRQLGMITMDDALYDLFSSGTITREMAMTYAQDQQYLRKKINGQ